ncbi:Phenazine biosynthesis protein PhzG [Clavibacter michiganensis subsp. michiganensis]|uniref:Phenazine biosynthesis protein PhzG n=1 Tax=Clavibacter michiganensis subsp. michiganensis TaxID=33013 RepID=A0A251XHC1_CLAMM|nr:Phenazine biosynthesis protein PhzG [Clavibacter michiganensis subsp. michiganensis]OUE01597.1 Phenazine biosynthesis protein PhzG [Clavibacter michiganensis subsp. michiganensis]
MADDDDSTSIRDLLTGAKPAPHDFPQLDPADLPDDPIDLVIAWIRDAVAHDAAEPNAVVLATADAEGRPSARTLLLKDVTPTVDDEPGALWFSSLADSPKGRDLEANRARRSSRTGGSAGARSARPAPSSTATAR